MKKPDHFVLLYSTGSGCILSIHRHYQKWHTVCSCSCSLLPMWICCLNPESSCDSMRDSLHQLTNPESASYILLGIFPPVNLIFAVNTKEITGKVKTWCGWATINFYPSKKNEVVTASTATVTGNSALHKK